MKITSKYSKYSKNQRYISEFYLENNKIIKYK